MKRWLFLILLIIIVTSIIFFGNQKTVKQEQPETATPTPILTLNFPNLLDIEINQNTYRVAWEKVENSKNLVLIANFNQRLPSQKIVSDNKCLRAINGGFYTTSYLPLGLFSIRGEKLGNLRESHLTNGFFWIDEEGATSIGNKVPEEILSLPFIFQSGPLIKINGALQKLSIVNDKPARRMFIAIDNDGQVVFLTVFDEKNLLHGPYLESLGELVNMMENKLAINLIDVLNLDGGTASTFWSGASSLDETSLVGSILCERE